MTFRNHTSRRPGQKWIFLKISPPSRLGPLNTLTPALQRGKSPHPQRGHLLAMSGNLWCMKTGSWWFSRTWPANRVALMELDGRSDTRDPTNRLVVSSPSTYIFYPDPTFQSVLAAKSQPFLVLSVGALEYTDWISAESLDSSNECSRYETKLFDGEAQIMLAQSAWAVEYTDCTSAEG